MTGDQIIDMRMESLPRLLSDLGTDAWKCRVIGESVGIVNTAFLHCDASQSKWELALAELETMWEQRAAQKEAA